MPRNSKSIVSLVINCGYWVVLNLNLNKSFVNRDKDLIFSNMKFSEVAVDV